MTPALAVKLATKKYANNGLSATPSLMTSGVSGGSGSGPLSTQSLSAAGPKPLGAGSLAQQPSQSLSNPSSTLFPNFDQRKQLGRAGMSTLMGANQPVQAANPVPAPPPTPPAPQPVNPTTPVLQMPNLTLAPPAPAPPPPSMQPQPIVSNTQGTMTDVTGKPVETVPPRPSGPEAFVDTLKQRSDGKEPGGGVIDMTKPLDPKAVEAHLGDVNVPPEQKQKFLGDLTEKLKHENPQYYEGFHDVQAGRTDTEAAKAYQGRMEQAKNELIQQKAQADPEKAATPQGFGEIVNGVMSTFQNMHPALQAMVGIGLPVGLIGIMSSMFGGGGMGMGILGALGLGAGVLGGAAGGMFGQGAQNMAADGLFNAGQFLGMIPEGKHDLSMLTADDPIAAIKAKGGGSISPAAVKEQLAKAEQQKQQLGMLMSLPEGMRPRMLQHLSNTNMTDEQAALAARNAAMLHGHLNDPKSELSQLQQQGQRYAEAPVYTVATEIVPQKAYEAAQGAYNAAHNAAQGAYNYTLGNSRMPWNWGKKGADMRINKLIEKWAFNDMDAKELSDLKAEKAKGAPYRVEEARREHELNLRNQATAPVEKKLVVMCMKSARCWAGYEPVPGKKPYSNDSCRPVGSKKKDSKKKAK